MGVTQLDHEQLVSKIGPCVGSHVTWTPEYIEIDGVIVLVITMDPPHLGDDIHQVGQPGALPNGGYPLPDGA